MMNPNEVERQGQLKWARVVTTIFVAGLMILFGCLARNSEETAQLLVPTSTPQPPSTPAPDLVSIEFQLEVVNSSPPAYVEFWYTSNSNGRNETDSARIDNVQPLSRTATVTSGTQLEIAAVLTNSGPRTLTCRILADGNLIAQNTSQGEGVSVSCFGLAFSQN